MGFAFLPVVILAMVQFSGSYQFYVVMSNSTAPSYETGDIVLLDKQLDFQNYKIGDAVLYSPPNFPEIIIHRIYDIKYINNTYYFAIKGDSNPQPDSVPETGNITNILLQNVTVTWSTFYNGNTTNPTAKYVIASYYPAKDVVFGRVIFRIPILGWLFVPFNSPFSEPFHILPISMFSLFSIYYICLIVTIFFLLMNKANFELKKLLNSLTANPIYHWTPSKIAVRNFYALVFYPLIFFILIFFSATPAPVVSLDQISLQSSDVITTNNVTYTKLVYLEQQTIDSLSVSQDNKTVTTLLISNGTDTFNVQVSKSSIFQGQNLQTALPYYITDKQFYTLTVDSNSMYVLSSNVSNVHELGLFFDYKVDLVPNTTPIGLMTQNVFLKASPSTYNGLAVYQTELNFSFIQDLISYDWNVKAYFSQTDGYLEFLQNKVTESLWAIPEILGLVIIACFTVSIYLLLKHQFQKMFDERQEKIITAQMNSAKKTNNLANSDQNYLPQNMDIDNPKQNYKDLKPFNQTEKVDKNEENSKDETVQKKKLSWEEYRKLEEGE